MTVYELIENLQACDRPDADVTVQASWKASDGAVIFGHAVPVLEVSTYETDGPVVIECEGVSDQ